MIKEEYLNYLRSKEWAAKRKEVFAIKGRLCQRCNTGENINVHHATYENVYKEDVRNDLYVLCETCHEQYHKTTDVISIGSTIRFIRGEKVNKRKRKIKQKKHGYKYSYPNRNKKFKVSKLRVF